VLDTDAHAGNGTAEYLRSNTKTLYIDIHQDPRTIYPGTGFVQDIGMDAAKGLTINLPCRYMPAMLPIWRLLTR
jgi:acetoin utilization deacetylase AcuC-like enzyme